MSSSEFDYQKYLALLSRNKILFAFGALTVMTIITIGSYLLPKKYEAKSTVFIEKSVIGDLIKGLAITPTVEDKIKALTYSLNSRTLIVKVIDELDMNTKKSGDAYLESLIADLQKNTVIKIRDKEGLFQITFKSSNPKLARDYVNSLVRRYIEENMSSKREDSYGATKFISEQLSTFKDKLTKAEQAVSEFKQRDGSIAAMDTTMLLKEMNDAQQRLDDNKIKQSQLDATLSTMSKSGSDNSKITVLQNRLEELQRQYTDSYPEIIKIREEIAAVEGQSKKGRKGTAIESPEYLRAASELRALRQAEANLRSVVARNRTLLHSVPAAKATLESLEREMQTQKTLYDQFVSRQGQSEVSKQMEVQDKSTNFRIVDPAILPINPISPDRVKIILLGIVAGIAAGAGLVFLKDQIDPTVKSVDTLKNMGLNVLAIIPRIENPEQIAEQSKKDRIVYICGGGYFCLIIGVFAIEVLKKAGYLSGLFGN
jgi:polysaccharide biosynthesis transport protein